MKDTEKLLALEFFVSELSKQTLCEEPDTKCSFDSGPYCSEHGTGDLEAWVLSARDIMHRVKK